MSNPTNWVLSGKPRQWQLDALHSWESSGRRGIASVVTGAGKTFFAEMAVLSFRDQWPDGNVIVVVPTLALLDQWYISLTNDIGVRENEVSTFSSEGAGPIRPINLMVINTARRWAERAARQGPSLLIVDECHRAASAANARALRGEHQATLGISATPNRDYDDLLEEVLIPALGPIVYWYGYNDARRDGVVSPFRLVNVRFDLTDTEKTDYERLTRRLAQLYSASAQTDEAALRRLLQRRARIAATARMRIPVAVRLLDQHRRERSIVFHEQIAAAEHIHRLLAGREHASTIYHSGLNPVIRRDNLRLYRSGAFNVLVTCRALDEGVNVPDTSVAVVASSTASTRQRIQRLGRVLRPAPGKTVSTIYTLYGTDVEEQRLAAEAQDLVEAEDVSWMQSRVGSDV